MGIMIQLQVYQLRLINTMTRVGCIGVRYVLLRNVVLSFENGRLDAFGSLDPSYTCIIASAVTSHLASGL